MARKPITVEEEIRGRIETIGRQIENFTEEATHQREAAAYNEELVESLTKLRADYAKLLGASESTVGDGAQVWRAANGVRTAAARDKARARYNA